VALPPGSVLLPNTLHFKEFYGGFTGTCGETALTAALVCAERLPDDEAQAIQLMLDITHQMQAMGWASANGASTLWSLAREAATKRGGTINLEWDYAEPFPHDWHSILLANAAVRPIVLQVANAYNLWGQDGTGNDEAGVHYHFICVVGKCADGYICMDGDNWAIEQTLSIYSYATLQAATICGLLMLDEKAPAPMPIPPNWTDDGTTLKAPNGVTVVKGFRSWVINHNPAWPEHLVPVNEEHLVGPVDVHQDFALTLYYNPAKTPNTGEIDGSVPASGGGDDEAAEAAATAALQAQLADAQAKVDALHVGAVSAAQVLNPLGAASNDVNAALKKAGF
jgi:hypothetical protein